MSLKKSTEAKNPIAAHDYKKDESLLKDPQGRYYTQGLFLEIGYKDTAIFTLDDRDKVYKGKTYPSLKRLYLEMADVVEINFANHFLWGWDQWEKMDASEMLRPHFDKWRRELDLLIKADAIQTIMDQSTDSTQAAKWLAARGWEVKGPGRPTKAQIKDNMKKDKNILQEFAEDAERLSGLERLN